VKKTKGPLSGHAYSPPADPPTNPVPQAGDASANGHAPRTTPELLTLTLQLPTVGVCVVAVEGELDALTAPLFNTCVREQLAVNPTHLILDLQPVRFLGSTGLTCLLHARELAQQAPGVQLHLAGMVTRAVARPLQITELLALFDTHATLPHALAALAS